MKTRGELRNAAKLKSDVASSSSAADSRALKSLKSDKGESVKSIQSDDSLSAQQKEQSDESFGKSSQKSPPKDVEEDSDNVQQIKESHGKSVSHDDV